MDFHEHVWEAPLGCYGKEANCLQTGTAKKMCIMVCPCGAVCKTVSHTAVSDPDDIDLDPSLETILLRTDYSPDASQADIERWHRWLHQRNARLDDAADARAW